MDINMLTANTFDDFELSFNKTLQRDSRLVSDNSKMKVKTRTTQLSPSNRNSFMDKKDFGGIAVGSFDI